MVFPDPLQDIGDQIGVRVITYVQSDVATVADILHDQLVVHDDRDRGRETARLGQFGYASRHLQVSTPSPRRAGRRTDRRPDRPDPDPHRAAARLGRVRTRYPLQGNDSCGARQRLRPEVHPGGRPAGARRQRVLDHPRSVAHRSPGARPAPIPTSPMTTPGSAPANSPRSWPASTPTPGGRGPSTTPGSPACCSSSASRRWPNWPTPCAASTRHRSRPGWATATRQARCGASTTPCCSGSATGMSAFAAMPIGWRRCSHGGRRSALLDRARRWWALARPGWRIVGVRSGDGQSCPTVPGPVTWFDARNSRG